MGGVRSAFCLPVSPRADRDARGLSWKWDCREFSDRGELGPAVLLPAALVLFGAELLLLAVADDAEPVGGDACRDQCGPGGVGAVFAERQVVFGRTTIVAVAADDDLDGGMSGEIRGGLGD